MFIEKVDNNICGREVCFLRFYLIIDFCKVIEGLINVKNVREICGFLELDLVRLFVKL